MSKPPPARRPATANRPSRSADEKRSIKSEAVQPRVCDYCDVAFLAEHGNRKYHPECAPLARSEKNKGYSRQYRRKARAAAGRPPAPEFRDGNVRVRGVAMSGQKVLQLRAALWPLMLLTMQNHQHLAQFSPEQMRKRPERNRLRTLVDESRLVLDLLHDLLPDLDIDLDMADAEALVQAKKRRMSLADYKNRPRIAGVVRIKPTGDDT